MTFPPHEERGLLSRLPQDPQYWNTLAGRVTTDASPHLRSLRSADDAWWSVLGRLSPLLATAAAAAVLTALSLLPSRTTSPDRVTTEAFDFTPDDPIAGPLLSADAPPAVAALLGMQTGETER